MIKISVIIPTFNRYKQLERALESCIRQQGVWPDEYEIIVVDNSRDERARAVVDRLIAERLAVIRYLSEPRSGISHARNTGVAAASGELVAFLDDDGEADQKWLCILWSTYQQYGADLMWGALLPRFDGDLRGWDRFFNTYLLGVSARPVQHRRSCTERTTPAFARQSFP